MAAYSALLRGAAKVFSVDRVPERLAKAEEIGAIPIDFSKGDPAAQIKEQTGGEGTDKGVDAVGYQATSHKDTSHEEPAVVLNTLVETVRPTGLLGIPGLYVPPTRARPTSTPSTASSWSPSARCSRRASRWAPASATSSSTTASCAT